MSINLEAEASLRFQFCRYGVPEPYEKLKAFTRGQSVTHESMQDFVRGLEGIPEDAKNNLADLSPQAYIGNAASQARDIDSKLASLKQ